METMIEPMPELKEAVDQHSSERVLHHASAELPTPDLIDICAAMETWDHEQARRLNHQMQIRTLLALAPGIDQNVRYRMLQELNAITAAARTSGLDELQSGRTMNGAERDWSVVWDQYRKLIASPSVNQLHTPSSVHQLFHHLTLLSDGFTYHYPRQESRPRPNMAVQRELRTGYADLTSSLAVVLHAPYDESEFRLIAQMIGRLNFTPNADNRALDAHYPTDWRSLWQSYMDLVHRKYELLVRRTAMERSDRAPSYGTVAYLALVQRIAQAPNQTLSHYSAELPQFADPFQSQPLTTLATLAHNRFVSIAAPSADPNTWQLAPRDTQLLEDELRPLEAIEI